jgi:uncharacterized membrane protein YccF (DUF307 family)
MALMADTIRNKPWWSLGWGAIVLFATPVAAIVVCITIVGIPLGLIGLALYGIAIYLSQIPVALFIGRWIIGYFAKTDSRANPLRGLCYRAGGSALRSGGGASLFKEIVA